MSFEEFIAFQRFIDDVQNIKDKVLVYRFISIDTLKKLAKEFSDIDTFCLEHKVRISDIQIESLVKLLDLDDNGQLDHDEVIGVLEERMMLGQGRETEFKEAINSGVKKGIQWIKDTLKMK